MVGHSEPLHVKFTHFNPDDGINEKDESEFAYDKENRKPQNIEIIYEDDRMPNREFKINEDKLSDMDGGRIDFEVFSRIIYYV